MFRQLCHLDSTLMYNDDADSLAEGEFRHGTSKGCLPMTCGSSEPVSASTRMTYNANMCTPPRGVDTDVSSNDGSPEAQHARPGRSFDSSVATTRRRNSSKVDSVHEIGYVGSILSSDDSLSTYGSTWQTARGRRVEASQRGKTMRQHMSHKEQEDDASQQTNMESMPLYSFWDNYDEFEAKVINAIFHAKENQATKNDPECIPPQPPAPRRQQQQQQQKYYHEDKHSDADGRSSSHVNGNKEDPKSHNSCSTALDSILAGLQCGSTSTFGPTRTIQQNEEQHHGSDGQAGSKAQGRPGDRAAATSKHSDDASALYEVHANADDSSRGRSRQSHRISTNSSSSHRDRRKGHGDKRSKHKAHTRSERSKGNMRSRTTKTKKRKTRIMQRIRRNFSRASGTANNAYEALAPTEYNRILAQSFDDGSSTSEGSMFDDASSKVPTPPPKRVSFAKEIADVQVFDDKESSAALHDKLTQHNTYDVVGGTHLVANFHSIELNFPMLSIDNNHGTTGRAIQHSESVLKQHMRWPSTLTQNANVTQNATTATEEDPHLHDECNSLTLKGIGRIHLRGVPIMFKPTNNESSLDAADNLYDRAMEAWNVMDYHEAVKDLVACLRLRESNCGKANKGVEEAYFALGRCYWYMMKADQAIDAFRRCYRIQRRLGIHKLNICGPSNITSWIGKCIKILGIEEKETYIANLVESAHCEAQGDLALIRGNFDNALASYKDAIRFELKDSHTRNTQSIVDLGDLNFKLSFVYYQQGHMSLALGGYRLALSKYLAAEKATYQRYILDTCREILRVCQTMGWTTTITRSYLETLPRSIDDERCADVLVEQDNYKMAQARYESAIAAEASTTIGQLQLPLAVLHMKLAELLKGQGPEKAQAVLGHYCTVRSIQQTCFGKDDPVTRTTTRKIQALFSDMSRQDGNETVDTMSTHVSEADGHH